MTSTSTSTPTTAPIGVATVLGAVGAIVAAVGTVVAAIQANDVATATAGVAAIAAGLATLGGRYAQAIAQIRAGATRARPDVETLADGDQRELEATDGGVDPDPPVSVRSV